MDARPDAAVGAQGVLLAGGTAKACGYVRRKGEAPTKGREHGLPPCEPCVRGVLGPGLNRSSLGGFVGLPVFLPSEANSRYLGVVLACAPEHGR